MDFSEKWGTDVDEAVKLALLDLKLTIDEVDVTVLEQPSKGFFGIGSKLAKVKVEKKKIDNKQKETKVAAAVDNMKAKTEKSFVKKENDKVEKQPEIKESEYKPEKVIKPIIKREPEENLTPLEEHASIDFLKETIEKMGLALKITAKMGENCIYIDIEGKDSGTIIGKRGQTLDAIQYLTSLVVNKGKEKYIRVVVDAENYRAKREKTLEQLGLRLAERVVKTNRNVRLEPMNPYERKVIHATLQNNPQVTTKSEGEEPYRRVIIELK
ncbi:MAG: RNA-binding cell elongation regulator Jag/EloR [Anaerovoracaceae bacterium]